MKKIYFMTVFLGATSFAFNQVQRAPVPGQQLSTEIGKTIPTNYIPTKAVGTAIWTDNFDDPTTWTIDNNSQTDLGIGWDINSTVDGWYFNNRIVSTSGGNFAELGNGDAGTTGIILPMNVVYTLTTATPIAISTTGLTLEFLQYGALFNDTQQFQISTDGTTFVTVGSNDAKGVLSNTGGSAYDNPDKVVIHLADYLTSAATQVWVRFQWTSRFPTETTNQNAWVTYGWMIDDVSISTIADNDLQALRVYMGSIPDTLVYYQIPLAQVAPITGGGTIKNVGLNNATNVKFKAAETIHGLYTSESNPTSILAGTSTTLALNDTYTPPAKGDYKIEYSEVSDSLDDVPSNNTFKPYEFTVGDYIYAIDTSTDAKNGVIHNDLFTNGLQGNKIISLYANAYEIIQDADLTGIDFQFGSQIKEGDQVQIQVYEDANPNPTYVDEGQFYTIKLHDEGTYHTLAFNNPVHLTAGKIYYAIVQMFSDSLSIATSGMSHSGASLFKLSDDVWSGLSGGTPAFVIRMNFDPTLSVKSNELSNLNLTQFPNPFANETTVRFSLKEASNVSYTITDMTGKVVADVNKGNLMTGNHEINVNGSSLANGIYYFNLKTNDAQVTRKMVVNK